MGQVQSRLPNSHQRGAPTRIRIRFEGTWKREYETKKMEDPRPYIICTGNAQSVSAAAGPWQGISGSQHTSEKPRSSFSCRAAHACTASAMPAGLSNAGRCAQALSRPASAPAKARDVRSSQHRQVMQKKMGTCSADLRVSKQHSCSAGQAVCRTRCLFSFLFARLSMESSCLAAFILAQCSWGAGPIGLQPSCTRHSPRLTS